MNMDNLGAWSGDDFNKTIAAYGGSAYYSKHDHVTQFTHGVSRLLRKHLAKTAPQTQNKVSLFIFGICPDYPSKRVPRLDSGSTSLDGSIWFVAREVVSGRQIAVDANDDHELFEFVCTTLQAGNRPTILFDRAESDRMIRLYPKGLDEMDCCYQFSIDAKGLSSSAVKKAITHTYETRLITPSASNHSIKLWECKEKHYPKADSEKEIQSHLVTGLASWFPACRVKEEQTGVAGRYDIAIIEPDPLDSSVWTHHVLLELKVIRSFGNSGIPYAESKNKEWLKSGMDQAYSYREEHNFKFAALCCFDMQVEDDGNKCFCHIEEDAKKLLIDLWRWYVHSTAKEHRTVLTSKALKD